MSDTAPVPRILTDRDMLILNIRDCNRRIAHIKASIVHATITGDQSPFILRASLEVWLDLRNQIAATLRDRYGIDPSPYVNKVPS